jgi:hypothetical protein
VFWRRRLIRVFCVKTSHKYWMIHSWNLRMFSIAGIERSIL